MSEIARLQADLEAARGDLLASFAGISAAAFARQPPAHEGETSDRLWSVRDVLWHAGLVEDWVRRAIDQGVNGRAVTPYAHRDRPAIAETPEYLVEWLEQCRRPLLALLRRLSDDALDTPVALADGTLRTPRRMLEHVAAHDREHVLQIEALQRLDE